MKTLTRLFIKGLAVILPIALTIYILVWMGAGMERLARGAILKAPFIAEADYFPGLGIMAGVAIVLLIGVLAEMWIFRSLIGVGESILLKIPLVRTIFGGLRDLMDFLASASTGGFGDQTVMVDVGRGMRLMGFVTRKEFEGLPQGIGDKDKVAVYMPMSYQIGGYTAFLPKENVEAVAMPADDAMAFVLTAGMSSGRRGANAPSDEPGDEPKEGESAERG